MKRSRLISQDRNDRVARLVAVQLPQLRPTNNSLTIKHFAAKLILLIVAMLAFNVIAAATDDTKPVAASSAEVDLARYRAELQAFRTEFGGTHDLPDVPFFLFGMGDRRGKLIYRSGALISATTGEVLQKWLVRSVTIVPPAYCVAIITDAGDLVRIVEDEQAVWIEENGRRRAIEGSQHPVRLPTFDQNRYPQILRVLHQELLINVTAAGPVPNFFVYPKPWYRDGAMVAMALKETGNLDVLRDWILGLREPFDRNNAGITEADNLGQFLFLVSLVANTNHPAVARVLAEVPRFEVTNASGKFIKGRSDFAPHPAYQTKWLKYGLRSLSLPDPYVVPRIADSYSALFWMDYKDTYISGKDADDRGSWAYLGWASDHFHGLKKSPLSDRDYPLTWEANASQANYDGMKIIAPVFTKQKVAAPHTWLAAEAFLYLLEQKKSQ